MSTRFPSINVDELTGSLHLRTPVRLATTVAGTLATGYVPGVLIDGVALVLGDRVLIKNQVSPIENGVYIVQAVGAPVRAPDFDNGPAGGLYVPVLLGSTQTLTTWVSTVTAVIGTDPITFVQKYFYGAMPVSRGGTGNTSLTSNGVLIGAGTTPVSTSKAAPTGAFVGTTDTQTLTNKTLTTPVIDTIRGSNNNGVLDLIDVASAVNRLSVTNAIATAKPKIAAVGTDANIDLNLQPKGTGKTRLLNGGLAVSDAGANEVTVIAPSGLGANYTLTLPPNTGTSGQYLRTDGSGVTTWVSNPASLRTYTMTNYVTNVNSSVYVEVAQLTWRFGTSTTVRNIIWYYDAGANRTLSFKLVDVDNSDATLFEVTALTGSGYRTDAFTNVSAADTRLKLMVRKNAAGGINPIVTGVVLDIM